MTEEKGNEAQNIKKYLNQEIQENELFDNIHYLQLHPNYAYEDFIVGMQIRNHETVVKKGFLYEVIDKAKDEPGRPHVIILDEINRVDLSRLFGELFSGIENRGQNIKIPIGGETRTLAVPENIYFIGTMNEIDFSLERIDFALRRRFCWFFHGFNPDTLRSMIDDKLKTKSLNIDDDQIDLFVERADKLNKSIEENDDLGVAYQIGHTFFAEIVDITEKTIKEHTKKTLYNKSGANDSVNILWNISIQPMIEAFYGNLDKTEKETKINAKKDIFLKGTNG